MTANGKKLFIRSWLLIESKKIIYVTLKMFD